MFDLNIDHYNKEELEELFDLSTIYTSDDVESRTVVLLDNVSHDTTINETTRSNTIKFVENAKFTLIGYVHGFQNAETNTIFQQGSHMLIQRPVDENMQRETGMNEDPVYTGNINPIRKRTTTKMVNIDSRFRDSYSTSTSSNFQLNLPTKITKCLGMEMKIMEPPSSYYTISEKLKNNYFWVEISGTSTKVTVSDGNYINNGSEVIGQLFTALGNIDSNLQINFSSNGDSKVTITHTADFKLHFNLDSSGTEKQKPELELQLGWVLGFRSASYSGTSTTSVTSDACSDFIGPKYGFLIVDDFQNNVNETIISTSNNYIMKSSILSRISFSNFTNDQGYLNSPVRNFFGPTDIQKLKIQLVDEYGRDIDTNGVDFSFALLFTCVYDL